MRNWRNIDETGTRKRIINASTDHQMLTKTIQMLLLWTALLLWANHANAQLSCIWEGGIVACPEDCAEKGGLAQCTAPVITSIQPEIEQKHEPETMFRYSLCDNYPSSTGRYIAWCQAIGGTWAGGGVCLNRPEWYIAGNADSKDRNVFVPVSNAFVNTVRDICTVTTSDTGWGQSGAFPGNCSGGVNTIQNGI